MCNLALGATGPDIRQHGCERHVTDAAGGRQQTELGFVLDRAQCFDRLSYRDECNAVGALRHERVSSHGDVVVLETEPLHAGLTRATNETRHEIPIDQQVEVRSLLTRLRGVAAISGKHRCTGQQQQCGVRAGETGEVADVHETRHQQRVDGAVAGLRQQPLATGRVDVTHASAGPPRPAVGPMRRSSGPGGPCPAGC